MKWFKSDNVFNQYDNNGQILDDLDPGVYRVESGLTLYLRKINEGFSFNHKLYDIEDMNKSLDYIMKTWDNESFKKSNKNLGIIFNGIKGTGKTITAKVLSNRTNLPIICVPENFEGLEIFLSNITTECVILIDEMEKIFDSSDSTLLKLLDGVNSMSRKMVIMTTNTLNINENLIDRPGRVRYMKKFDNISLQVVKDYLKDNLKDMSKEMEIIKFVNSLSISTIDILGCIVEEVNIHGSLSKTFEGITNLERSYYELEYIFCKNGKLSEEEFKKIIPPKLNSTTYHRLEYLSGSLVDNIEGVLKKWESGEKIEDESEDEYVDSIASTLRSKYNITTSYLRLWDREIKVGTMTTKGIIVSPPDEDGYLILKSRGTLIQAKILETPEIETLYGDVY